MGCVLKLNGRTMMDADFFFHIQHLRLMKIRNDHLLNTTDEVLAEMMMAASSIALMWLNQAKRAREYLLLKEFQTSELVRLALFVAFVNLIQI